jgi:hypothetical protein
MINKCGTVGGMRALAGEPKYRRKPTPVSLFSPQIPCDMTWDRTQATAVGSCQLTAQSVAWSYDGDDYVNAVQYCLTSRLVCRL